MLTFLAILIFVLTLFLIIKQPYKIPISYSATFGATIAVISGVVSVDDVFKVVNIVWDPTLAFIGIIFISLILDKIGFFEWISLHMIHFASGDGKKLFIYVLLLCAIVSAFFANDGAALIITPIVYQKIKYLGLRERYILPFVVGSGFVADSTSLPFLISNLVNLLTADYFHIAFFEYTSKMFFVNILSLMMSLFMLYTLFKKDLIKSYDTEVLEDKPAKLAIKDPFVFRIFWVLLIPLIAGFLIADFYKIPLSFVILTTGILLFLSSLKNKTFNYKTVILKETPWGITIFSVGMYIVVYGLKNVGLTVELSNLIELSLSYGEAFGIFVTGILAAMLSCVMNNLPTVMIMNLSIDSLNISVETKKALAYANIIGCDLGPKITPIGSLATLLWLFVLEQKGIKIGWMYYFKTGIVLTIPTLVITLLGLIFMVL